MLDLLVACAFSVVGAQQVPRRVEPRLPRVQNQFEVPMGLTAASVVRAADPLPSDEELKKRVVSEELRTIVRDLGAPEYAKRRAASSTLRQNDVAVEDLLSVLARGELDAEQQHRLVAIAAERVLTEFGALGVTMDLAMRGAQGAHITGCVPGLPAEKFLQVDDLVVAIEGRAVAQPDDLTRIVQSMAPGTKVRIELLRGERDAKGKPRLDADGRQLTKRVEVTFPLASARELGDAAAGGLSRIRVSAERQEMARTVMRRYSPQPTIVVMPEDRDANKSYSALDPDRHADIQSLKRLRDMFDAERREWDANTLNALQATLNTLRRQADDPSYAPAQREWFVRVAKRYEELMPKPE